jgi:uncharacterized membrane protein
MLDVNKVMFLSGLEKEEIIDIMKNYTKYYEEYMEEI